MPQPSPPADDTQAQLQLRMQQLHLAQQHQQQQRAAPRASAPTPISSAAAQWNARRTARRNPFVAHAASSSGIDLRQMQAIIAAEKERLACVGTTDEQQQRVAVRALMMAHASMASGGTRGSGPSASRAARPAAGASAPASGPRPGSDTEAVRALMTTHALMAVGGASRGPGASAIRAARPAACVITPASGPRPGPDKEAGRMRPGEMQGGDAVPAAPKPGVVTSPGDETFWVKLEQVQRQYRANLIRLSPVIRCIRPEGQTPERKANFLSHVSDCYSICEIERAAQKPPGVTVEMLCRAAPFMGQLVSAAVMYEKLAAAAHQQQTAQAVGQQAAASQQAAAPGTLQQTHGFSEHLVQQQAAMSAAPSSSAVTQSSQLMTPHQAAAARAQAQYQQHNRNMVMLRRYAAAIGAAKASGDSARATKLITSLQTYNANLRQRPQPPLAAPQ